MKILITGAGGQLGRELKRSLAPLGEVVACDRKQLDLGNPDALRLAVHQIAPNLIVNAAAWTAVDKAETEPDAANAINGIAPGILAEEAKRLGAQLIHYSTDYVFDGNKATPWTEEDLPRPLSIYGRTKLVGEQAIQSIDCRYLILRTSWIFGLHGANFMKTMLRVGKERPDLRVVADQFGAPTWTRHLADATALVASRTVGPSGLYHLANAGETSWHGYAEEVFAEAVRLGLLASSPKSS